MRFEVVGTSLKLFYGRCSQPDSGDLRLRCLPRQRNIRRAGQQGTTLSPTTIDNVDLSAVVSDHARGLSVHRQLLAAARQLVSRNWTERQGNYTVNVAAPWWATAPPTGTLNGILTNSSIPGRHRCRRQSASKPGRPLQCREWLLYMPGFRTSRRRPRRLQPLCSNSTHDVRWPVRCRPVRNGDPALRGGRQ